MRRRCKTHESCICKQTMQASRLIAAKSGLENEKWRCITFQTKGACILARNPQDPCPLYESTAMRGKFRIRQSPSTHNLLLCSQYILEGLFTADLCFLKFTGIYTVPNPDSADRTQQNPNSMTLMPLQRLCGLLFAKFLVVLTSVRTLQAPGLRARSAGAAAAATFFLSPLCFLTLGGQRRRVQVYRRQRGPPAGPVPPVRTQWIVTSS